MARRKKRFRARPPRRAQSITVTQCPVIAGACLHNPASVTTVYAGGPRFVPKAALSSRCFCAATIARRPRYVVTLEWPGSANTYPWLAAPRRPLLPSWIAATSFTGKLTVGIPGKPRGDRGSGVHRLTICRSPLRHAGFDERNTRGRCVYPLWMRILERVRDLRILPIINECLDNESERSGGSVSTLCR